MPKPHKYPDETLLQAAKQFVEQVEATEHYSIWIGNRKSAYYTALEQAVEREIEAEKLQEATNA